MALCVALWLTACAGTQSITGERRNVGGVTVTFRVEPARVQVGQAVRLTVRLVNNTGNRQRLTFPSAKLYDFWVTLDGEEVWRWSDERVFAQQVTHETIDGQSGTSFDESWTPESRGTFVAHAELEAEGYGGDLTGEVRVG